MKTSLRRNARNFVGVCAVIPTAILGVALADDGPETSDLDFLLGEWRIERVYQPATEKEQRLTGRLVCQRAVSDQFIKCEYRIPRTDRASIHDVVYFNYNAIYGAYESIWLSATWPIKNTMSAAPGQDSEAMVWASEFLIENDVTEYVRSTWRISGDGVFSRRTDIRTSKSPTGDWLHWMDETAIAAE